MFALVHDPIDVRAVRDAVAHPGAGAVLVFEGTARDSFEGRTVTRLSYEAYEEMALKSLRELGREVADRWPQARLAIVHRLGEVPVGEPTVVIAVSAPHRAEAYAASRHALEQLKARVPVWKKEHYADGEAWKPNAS